MIKTASLRPSDFASGPLDLDPRRVDSLSELTIDQVSTGYMSPTMTPDSYLHLRHTPVIWSTCCSHFSRNHLFIHALALAQQDQQLKTHQAVIEEAHLLCMSTGYEEGLMWLVTRPPYTPRMRTLEKASKFPAWSWEAKNRLNHLAQEQGLTARQILLIYSCKSMLTSDSNDLGGYRPFIESEVSKWDQWLSTETLEITDFITRRRS